MRKQKIIIFDLDGTAIDTPERQAPSKRLIDAIHSAKSSYHLCAATGRVWSFAQPVLRSLGLVDPCIISAGTQICNPLSGKVLWETVIEPKAIQAVVVGLRKYPTYTVLYNDYDESTYFHGASMPLSFASDMPIHFLGILFVPEDKARVVAGSFSSIDGITSTLALSQRPGFIDILITHKEATKEHAVAKLLEILGATRENAIGIGDGLNDVHLFNAVDRKIAMGNAVM